MKYYQHHIGDFDKKTRHLSRLERSIYRDMLDLYYDSEAPLSADLKALCRKLMARDAEEIAAVEQVLSEFFTLEDDGWHNARCDEEIETYNHRASLARTNGQAGGRPKRNRKETQPVIVGIDAGTDEKANHKPLTKTQLALASENARATEDVSGKADPKHWKPVQDLLAHNLADLDDWEVDFLHSVKRKPALTKAQQDSLASIQGKISAKPEAAAVFVSVKRGSPGYEAWITHYRKTMGRATFYEKQDVLTVPTEFPSQDSEAA